MCKGVGDGATGRCGQCCCYCCYRHGDVPSSRSVRIRDNGRSAPSSVFFEPLNSLTGSHFYLLQRFQGCDCSLSRSLCQSLCRSLHLSKRRFVCKMLANLMVHGCFLRSSSSATHHLLLMTSDGLDRFKEIPIVV